MNTLYFRVDGSSTIGMGHVVRCLALADRLKDFFNCHFIMRRLDPKVLDYVSGCGFDILTVPASHSENEEFELLEEVISRDSVLVIDGYNFSKNYFETLRSKTGVLIQIDDLNQGFYCSDLVINHNLHADIEEYDYDAERTTILKGIRYCIIRDAFKRVSASSPKDGVLICMGGADKRNISKLVYESLRTHFAGKISIVIGPSNLNESDLRLLQKSDPQLALKKSLSAQEMVAEIGSHEFMICTASVVSLEACQIGTKLIVGFTEENQKKMSFRIASDMLGFNLGELYGKSVAGLSEELRTILKEDYSEMLARQKGLFDGNSKLRILSHIKKKWFQNHPFYSERFSYRILTGAAVTDEYLSWFEDSETKKHIEVSAQMQTLDSLVSYVKTKLESDNAIMWGIYERTTGKHIGNIKYEPVDWEKRVGVMGILIRPQEWRGRGVAPEAISRTADALKSHGIDKIYLGVSKDNINAVKAYEKIGFRFSQNEYINNLASSGIEMVLKL